MLDSPRSSIAEQESEERTGKDLRRTACFFLKREINCYVGLKERRPDKCVKRGRRVTLDDFIHSTAKVKSGDFPPEGF